MSVDPVEVLPCPKCESTNVHPDQFNSVTRNRFTMSCMDCDWSTATFETEDEARTDWNTRIAAHPCTRELRDALEKIKNWCAPVLCQNCAANRETALAALERLEKLESQRREALEKLFDRHALSVVRGQSEFTQPDLIDAILALFQSPSPMEDEVERLWRRFREAAVPAVFWYDEEGWKLRTRQFLATIRGKDKP